MLVRPGRSRADTDRQDMKVHTKPESLQQPEALLLTPLELDALSARLAANADRLIQQHQAKQAEQSTKQSTVPKTKPAGQRGRPTKRISNPFCGLIGPTTGYKRYPYFSAEIIEGIARLDWHDRPIGKGGSSKPLSVRSLMVILEEVEEVTTESVADIIGTKARQAQRYVKAIELAMPFLLKSRPKKLVYEMGLPEDEFVNAAYEKDIRATHLELLDDVSPPSREDLAKLRTDLGEDAFDPDHRINAAYFKEVAPKGDHEGLRPRTTSSFDRPQRDGVAQAVA